MSDKRLVTAIFSIVFGAVLLIFTLKGALLMGRYGITANGKNCEKITDNETVAVSSSVSHEYIFTVVVYGILSVLRFLEYLLLGIQFYYFIFKQRVIDVTMFFTKHSQRFYYIIVFSVVLLPYFSLGIVIPSLGIYQEIEHSERLAGCYRHYHEIYIAYSVINILRYMCAYTVRMMMIFTTLALSKYWFPDHDGPPAHTSSGNFTAPKTNREISEVSLDRGAVSLVNEDVEETEKFCDVESESDINRAMLEEVLEDWKKVSVDYQKRAKEYAQIGKQVQVIQDLFQTWFIIPWIVYFIASSLKTYNILRPWQADGDGNEPSIDIPQIYYLLYNVNQFITLLIPFLCAKKMNTYHQKYHKITRDLQLYTFEENSSRLALARQLLTEKDTSYDFLPRIWGTSITINISSPLYVILLLAGLFLSVTESLL